MSTYTPTTLGYAILGLLHEQPSSGYQLRKLFETTPIGHYSSSPGSIYPALRRLQETGLVQKILAADSSSGKKKVFGLTPRGIQALSDWLHSKISREDVVKRVHLLLLRFAFMQDLADREYKLAFLRAFKQEIEAYRDELQRFREEAVSSMPLHGLLALDHGIESFKMNARWADYAIEALQ